MYPVSVKGVLAAPSGEIVLLMNEREEWALPGGRIEIGHLPERLPPGYRASIAGWRVHGGAR
jgi:hypothetical protein